MDLSIKYLLAVTLIAIGVSANGEDFDGINAGFSQFPAADEIQGITAGASDAHHEERHRYLQHNHILNPPSQLNAAPHSFLATHDEPIFGITTGNEETYSPIVNPVPTFNQIVPQVVDFSQPIAHQFRAQQLPQEVVPQQVYPATPGAVVAPAAVIPGVAPLPQVAVPLLYRRNYPTGQKEFSYVGGPSSRSEVRDSFGNVRGAFNYIDANGKLQTRHYTADSTGFRVIGSDIPQ